MDVAAALDFARARHQGVLVTMRSNGRPQLSNVAYAVGDDDVVRISITASRAKYANLRREPWGALHVSRDDFYAYVVLEGPVTLAPVAAAPDDATVEELIAYYRQVSGEHPDWDDYRAAMVKDQRTTVRLTPERSYGMLGS